MKDFGKEVIIDLHQCSTDKFTRDGIKEYFNILCKKIDMKQCNLYFWDYIGYPEEYEQAPAHLKGTSAVQFISTSNITIHTLDILKRVYLNIFSCKDFDSETAILFSEEYFEGNIIKYNEFRRI